MSMEFKKGNKITDVMSGQTRAEGDTVKVIALKRHTVAISGGMAGEGDDYRVPLKEAMELAEKGLVRIAEDDDEKPARKVETKEGASVETPARVTSHAKEEAPAKRRGRPKGR